jgi:hypothetical protein
MLNRIRQLLRQTSSTSRIAAWIQYMIANRPSFEDPFPPFSYPYKSLHRERRTIRLLSILPGSRGSPIICLLTYAYLNSGTQYEALSYTWASKEPARRIQLDGRLFSVSGNLWLALERFRRPDTPRKIWVDQICINQSDEMEKSYQVRQMGAVYSQAKEVLIWLGPENKDTSLAVQAFQAYAAGEPEITIALRTRHSKPWRAVMKVIGNPYWNRVWIIQEIAHARKKTIFCGAHELSWDDFCFLSSSDQHQQYPLLGFLLIEDCSRSSPNFDTPCKQILETKYMHSPPSQMISVSSQITQNPSRTCIHTRR